MKKEDKVSGAVSIRNYILHPQSLKKIAICFFTGIPSGLPLAFIVNLLPVWFIEQGIDIKTIGLFTLIQLPYSLKFLWSSFIDNYFFKGLGRRRTWMLFSQIILFLLLSSYAFFNKKLNNMQMLLLLSFLVVFFSATQDIVVDAYRRDILSDNELALGNSIFVNSYRLASFIPASLSLILTKYFSWQVIFMINGMCMLPGIVLTLLISEPSYTNLENSNYFKTIIAACKDFFSRNGIKQGLMILIFILLYKLGDSMALSLIAPFYLKMGYSPADIGLIVKSFSLWVSIIFGILGGIIILKIGLNKSLFFFGLVQMITILGFVWLSSFGEFDIITIQEKLKLALVVVLEYIGIGLATSAYIAFIYKQTNPLYSATQIAFLLSLSSVPRTIISSTSGYLIYFLGGYYNFFLFCFLLSIPGMIILFKVAPLNEKYSS